MTFSSYFREAANDMAIGIRETMGEIVTVIPYTNAPNFSATPDLTLPTFDVMMVFMHRAETAFTDKAAYRTTGSKEIEIAMPIQTRRPVFSVMDCDLPFELRQKFRIIRFFDRTQREITNIKPDGVSRLEVDVVQLGRAAQLSRADPARWA